MSFTDSAGAPWEGRSFSENAFRDDDGSEPVAITTQTKRFRENQIGFAELLEAFKNSRVLIPLLPKAAGTKIGNHGLEVDTSSDMHIVAIEGPDKLPALPIFTSTANLQAWSLTARPVPSQFERALLAAASEGQTRVIVNPGSEDWFAIRRPAIESLAQQKIWIDPEDNPEVKALVSSAIKNTDILGYKLVSTDPSKQLQAEELGILLKLKPDATKDKKLIVADFLSALDYEKFNLLVDSLKISVVD